MFHKLVLGHATSQWFIFLHLKSAVDFCSQSLQMTSCSSFQLIFFFFVKATSIFQSVHNYGMRRTGSGYMVHTYYCANNSRKSLFFSWLLLFFVKKTTLGQQQKSGGKKSPVIINKAKQVVM